MRYINNQSIIHRKRPLHLIEDLNSDSIYDINGLNIPSNIRVDKTKNKRGEEVLNVYKNGNTLIGEIDLFNYFDDGIIRFFSEYKPLRVLKAKKMQTAINRLVSIASKYQDIGSAIQQRYGVGVSEARDSVSYIDNFITINKEFLKTIFQVEDDKDIKADMVPVLEAFKLDKNTATNSYSKYKELGPNPEITKPYFIKLHGLLYKFPGIDNIIQNMVEAVKIEGVRVNPGILKFTGSVGIDKMVLELTNLLNTISDWKRNGWSTVTGYGNEWIPQMTSNEAKNPKSDSERAMAHYNISKSDWDKLSSSVKASMISKLPKRGSGLTEEVDIKSMGLK